MNEAFSTIFKSKKMVILTGAGISVNAGIPDFRSSNGLYNFNGQNNVKGKDLFDISLFQSTETIEVFAKFMASLFQQSTSARPTGTHKFISEKVNENKVVRCYTQNIDGIESQLGLNMKFDHEKKMTNLQKWKQLDVVQLHGDLNQLSCTTCLKVVDWDKQFLEQLANGELPECPKCLETQMERQALGKRSCTTIGNLRPNIVLYGENHPQSEIITMGLNSDLKCKTDLLLIFGTSLKVHGVKALVKSLAKQIHSRNGTVILINKDELNGWDGVIDHQVISDCDEFIEKYNKYERDMKSFRTPPSTPKKCRIRDVLNTPQTTPKKRTSINSLLNTPSPKKQRVQNLLNTPTKPFNIYKDTYISPQESPVRSPRSKKIQALTNKSSQELNKIRSTRAKSTKFPNPEEMRG